MEKPSTPLMAAAITAAATIAAAIIGAVNASRSGQQITVGSIVSNVFNFQGATVNAQAPDGEATRQTTIGGPTIRFGVNANALVNAWDQSNGFRVFINGIDQGWQRGGKAFPVASASGKTCQIEFIGSPDDPAKGKPVNVSFSHSCK